MKLMMLLAITVMVNSTCQQSPYHIFTYTSLDFLQEIFRMPRSGKKSFVRTFFLLTRNFILTILKSVKKCIHKNNSLRTLVIDERDPWSVFKKEAGITPYFARGYCPGHGHKRSSDQGIGGR
jgi:hypothetical protein